MVKQLDIHPVAHTLPINAINATNTVSKGVIRITIQSTHNDFSKELTCRTIPAIIDSIPSEIFTRESIKISANIKLTNLDFHVPRSVDLLIGAERVIRCAL